jgi:multicomponent Na+:H+ antiporter subunit E
VGRDRQPSVDQSRSETISTPKSRFAAFNITRLISFLILFILWIIFSGRFDLFHLILGAVSSGIVATFSGELMFTTTNPKGIFLSWLRLARYIPWLIYQVFLANLHVMYLVFHPRMMDLINPQIIEFESCLKGDYARTTFANSITLTPGTITVNVTVLGLFSVHCIDERSGQVLPGEMEARITKVFRE